ncbi:MAG: SseB family protein [Rhodobacteraceae bacterium]|nr:MAG: SseB family protein [Paracoccaceae bacterium]
MSETPIDQAHARMEAAPENDALRLSFFERLADGELFLLLESDAQGDVVDPRIFETGEGRYVLAFDREERLTAFAAGPVPYAAISGRALSGVLQDQNLGIGLNLGVAPSETLLPSGAVKWLWATLSQGPSSADDLPEEFLPPTGLPETLVTALDTKLATATGYAKLAYLVEVVWKGARRGHLLAFIDPLPGAETALAAAVREALVFSGLEAGEMDVTFLEASHTAARRLSKVGLRFDLPTDETAQPPSAPGMNPERPPRLR